MELIAIVTWNFIRAIPLWRSNNTSTFRSDKIKPFTIHACILKWVFKKSSNRPPKSLWSFSDPSECLVPLQTLSANHASLLYCLCLVPAWDTICSGNHDRESDLTWHLWSTNLWHDFNEWILWMICWCWDTTFQPSRTLIAFCHIIMSVWSATVA